MPGHLFIVDGDLTKLACDAWLLPTDPSFSVSGSFAHAVGLEKPDRLLQPPWRPNEFVRLFSTDSRGEDPDIWLGDVGRYGADVSHYVAVATAFVDAASAHVAVRHTERRHLPLLAVNVLGSGHGGKASEKGELCEVLIPTLQELVNKQGVDIALVTWGRPAYSAAQRVRRRMIHQGGLECSEEQIWTLGSNATTLRKTAADLAAVAKNGDLVLFIGAGASVEAGLPTWQHLIDLVAKDLNLSEAQIAQLEKLDLRDQASILRSRAQTQRQNLGQLIERHTEATRCSLTHCLLASLNVREAITTNYDRLYEIAVSKAGQTLSVLPGTHVKPGCPWLLKLHGSIDDAKGLVLTREDYFGLLERRGALLGLVQAMLLTKTMVFVGYSLTDEDFHSVMNDVRKAASGNRVGIVLALFDQPFFADLWRDLIKVVTMHEQVDNPTDEQRARAGRLVQIFLDFVGYQVADLSAYLLDDDYEDMLTSDEVRMKAALTQLRASIPEDSEVAGWKRVESLLVDFGDSR